MELSHTYVCLWPQFLTSLLTLLKEFNSEREEELPEVFEEDVKITVGDGAALGDAVPSEKDENTSGSYAVELAAASCVVALLEDPQEGEVTSPGMCLEVSNSLMMLIVIFCRLQFPYSICTEFDLHFMILDRPAKSHLVIYYVLMEVNT